MNILMVCIAFPPHFGGAAIQATYLAHKLKAKQINVEFVTDNGSAASETSTYQGFKVKRLKTFVSNHGSKLRELIYVCRLLFYILKNPRFEIIHFHSMRGLEAVIYPLLILLGRKVLLKLTLVDNDDPMTFKQRKKLSLLYMWGLKKVTHIVAISSRLKDSALKAGLKNDSVSIIFNGVDTRQFVKLSRDKKESLKHELGYGQFKEIFISVGQVEHRKGYDILVDAYRKISMKYPDSALLIIGPNNSDENKYYQELRAFISEHQIKNIFFLGRKSDVDPYMQISDCFLFCSRAEGFGTVLIEAMSAGVPVVATHIPGVTDDIIKNKDIGKICYSMNPEDFARDVIDFMGRRDAGKIDQAAQQIRQQFSIDNIADQYIKLYQKMLGVEN